MKNKGAGKFEKSENRENFESPSTFILLCTNEKKPERERELKKMNVVHGLKRIPRIKFPQRHLKPSGF